MPVVKQSERQRCLVLTTHEACSSAGVIISYRILVAAVTHTGRSEVGYDLKSNSTHVRYIGKYYRRASLLAMNCWSTVIAEFVTDPLVAQRMQSVCCMCVCVCVVITLSATSYSHSYVESGMRSGYLLTYGTRPSSPSLKRATGLNVVITVEFHFCLLPARYLPDCYRIGCLL